jgi:hypothetical protein
MSATNNTIDNRSYLIGPRINKNKNDEALRSNNPVFPGGFVSRRLSGRIANHCHRNVGTHGYIPTVTSTTMVGQCGVIPAKRLGAEQVILMGRRPERLTLGKEFGATIDVSVRSEEAFDRMCELNGGSNVF